MGPPLRRSRGLHPGGDAVSARKWNPYYVAHARSKGLTPEALLNDGRPNTVRNAEFIGWIHHQWTVWAREGGFRNADEARLRTRDAAAVFGAWLERTWP